MPFAANIAVEQRSHRGRHYAFVFYIYTPADVYQHTFYRSRVATLPPLEKSTNAPPWKKSFRRPCTQRLINHAQLINHAALITFD